MIGYCGQRIPSSTNPCGIFYEKFYILSCFLSYVVDGIKPLQEHLFTCPY